MTRAPVPALAFLLLGLLRGESRPQPARQTPPPHLTWAIKLLENIRPHATLYRHRPSIVTWKGVDGATASESRTDCSGLLDALVKRAYHLDDADLEKWLGARRPLAATWHRAIVKENKFTRRTKIEGARPGDVIAIKYERDKPPGGNTGHVLLVAAKPRKREATAPLVKGMLQWEVAIIDQSSSGHGPTDTRHKAKGGYHSGLGRGILRLYTDTAGKVTGYTWSTTSKSIFRAQADHPMAIGRLVPPLKPKR